MAVALGKNTLCGLKKESTVGTAIAVGALNQREIKGGSSIGVPATKERNDDALTPAPTQAWAVEEVGKSTLKMDFRYQGHELEIAVGMGAATTPDQRSNIKAYVNEFTFSALADAMTLAIGKGQGKSASSDIVEVAEVAGMRVKSWKLSQDKGRLTQEFELVGKSPVYGSSTNTTTTILTVTMPDASYPTNLAQFSHLAAWLAHQDQDTFSSSDAICIEGYELSIDFGLTDSVDDNLCTSGMQVGIAAAQRKVELTLKFLRDNTDTKVFYDLVRDYELLKCKLIYTSDKGIPGTSTSFSSPSTDISGGTDDTLKVKLTLTKPDGTTIVETNSVTLTTAGMNTGALIAAELQSKVRAVTATDTRIQRCLDKFTCDYDTTVSGRYFCTVASSDLVKVEIEDGDSDNVADDLKLGAANGGTEITYVEYGMKLFFPELDFDLPDDSYDSGAMKKELSGVAMIQYASDTPVGFTSSDDDWLQSDMDSEEFRVAILNRNSSAVI